MVVGIGAGGKAVESEVIIYRGIRNELGGKTKEELEGIVSELTPKVDRENKLFGSGLAIFFGSLIGVGIAQSIGFSHEETLAPLQYLALPALGLTWLYSVTRGIGKGLDNRYNRDAAQQILDERNRIAA
jgi:hypothetical protein